MDFLKLINSFEDLLFEVLTWIIYYPLTMWRVIRHPLRMMSYSAHEQTDDEPERYTDSLSPPLLLLLTLALIHVVELSTDAPTIKATTAATRLIVQSDENLILARAFLFGMLPLFAAWRYVSARRLPLERKNLKAPFYGQCYLAAIYALTISLALMARNLNIAEAGAITGVGVLAATIWYLTVQTLQFRKSLKSGSGRALLLALRAYVEAVGAFLLTAMLVSGVL